MSSKSDLLASSSSNKKAENSSGKLSMKGNFKSLQILRLSSLGEQPSTCSSFNICFSTKEKKQKIMRLGKKKEKEKDSDTKCQFVDGVSRLICSPKTHNVPLRVAIDGTEWTVSSFSSCPLSGKLTSDISPCVCTTRRPNPRPLEYQTTSNAPVPYYTKLTWHFSSVVRLV
ncbi:hypothetical protein WDU94_012463 [Cyamophila willieti]